MTTELILIRHGNALRVNGDYVHAPLTALGESQAAQTGTYLLEHELPIDGFYTSPLRRAHETASIIGSKLGQIPKVKNGIQEIAGLEVPALAIFEALSVFDFVEDYLDSHAGKPLWWPIEGRVSKALLEIDKEHLNQRIVVVAHMGTISAVLAWAFPDQRLKWWRTSVDNCSLTRLSVNAAQITLLAVNQNQHLSPEIAPVQPPPPDRAVQATRKVMETVKPGKNSKSKRRKL